MKVYLDDSRPTPEGWVRAYRPSEVIELLERHNVEVVSLAHDLGGDGTGYDVIRWIKGAISTPGFHPPVLVVHSGRSSAVRRMQRDIDAIGQFVTRQDAVKDGLHVMDHRQLLVRLAEFPVFGVSQVQRIAKLGYQQALDTVAAFEADGSISYVANLERWRISVSSEQLKAIYEQHKAELKLLPELLLNDVQPVIVMDVPEKWASAHKRVLVVGQETMWWDFRSGDYYDWPYPPITSLKEYLEYDGSVGAMMHGYRAFEFAAHQPRNYNSAFWRAYRQVRLAVGDDLEGFESTVLYTNLFKNAVDGGSIVKNGSEQEADALWQYSAGLLSKEIGVIKPDAVIMFTGPDYDRYLNFEFAGVKFIEVEGHVPRGFSKLSHPLLPEQTYRTYHPNYLSRGHWHLVDEVCEQLRRA